MEVWTDFFHRYLTGGIQMLTGFHFFMKCLHTKRKAVSQLLLILPGILILTVVPAGGIAEFVAYVLLLIAGGMLTGRNRPAVILYALTTVEIMQFSNGIFNSISDIICPPLFSSAREAVSVVTVVLGVLALLMSAFCYHIIERYCMPEKATANWYLLIILVPSLLIFLTGLYFDFVVYGNAGMTDSAAYTGNPQHYQVLLLQLLGILSLFCIIYVYKKLAESFHIRTKLSLLEQEGCYLQQYVEEARTRYENTRSLRHDIQNHILVIKELLEDARPEAALDYIRDLQGLTENASFRYSTNNPVVDVLIGNKLGIARDKGIEALCSLCLPHPCPVSDIDFCIILSNALDNAIQGCQDMREGMKKYIHVSGNIQGDFILLEVENSFQGKTSVQWGRGLLNIKAVAEKYDGAVDVRIQDSVFVLSVLLVVSQPWESSPQHNGSESV